VHLVTRSLVERRFLDDAHDGTTRTDTETCFPTGEPIPPPREGSFCELLKIAPGRAGWDAQGRALVRLLDPAALVSICWLSCSPDARNDLGRFGSFGPRFSRHRCDRAGLWGDPGRRSSQAGERMAGLRRVHRTSFLSVYGGGSTSKARRHRMLRIRRL
jgi:hypothetical protein